MNTRWRITAASAAAILLCVYLFARSGADGTSGEPPAEPTTATDRLAPPPSDETVAEQPLRLASSLNGTQEDGALIVDAEGRFQPTPDAIDLFDYYLSALGEEAEDQIRARIVAVIRARLEGDAARVATALLDDYLLYRTRAASELTGRLDGVDLARRLQYVRELRRDVFGAGTALALFGEEEDQWFADLERRRLVQDDSLDPADRERRLATLDDDLPESSRTIRDAPRAHRLLRDEEARLLDNGADANEIDRFREEQFGRESATRLAALDTLRLEWQARLQAYRVERDELLGESDAENQAERIEDLRAQHFEAGERVRVRALDQIEGARR